ncbi:M20/M25/M40 family metallo-hydrolase [Lewinella cohaerens]|uniref:M20/M25/M40 family metallo-hydrolase n=1 Tax=Lewinella cohaerens TaxID=70995 RepID=UPI000371163D|nr:M20/M25/M40 family metallo-hydrolase [Lewinella cohaerens]
MEVNAQHPVCIQVIQLLEQLICTRSFSKEEKETADLIAVFFENNGLAVNRSKNNVWVKHPHWQTDLPVILLNSHHDTVKPAASWQRDPFVANWEGDQLFGLGSNDAGGPLVSLIAAFLLLKDQKNLPFNLIMAATAEEEISGAGGIAHILPELGPLAGGIVGEPTLGHVAIAERGLIVIDGEAKGVSGHAAREEGTNALYIALDDIAQLREYTFPKISSMLEGVKVSVTQIAAGSQHNVVPDRCQFVVDVRVNEHYTNEEVVAALQAVCQSKLTPRSLRLQSSGIAADHPLAKAVAILGLSTYGSPTLSDQALMPFPTIKLGPGDSARSHTADEFIRRTEIIAGIKTYLSVLGQLKFGTARK